MTQYVINIGAVPNDGTGDPLRTAFNEVNLNFDQVWATGLVGSNIAVANNTIRTTNTNGNLVLAPNGIGIVQSNAHVVPDQTRIRNLGSPTRYWDTVYAQYAVIASDLTISGNLTVQGNIIQVGNIVTESLTIQLANAASTPSAADGSGITVGANDDIATILYNSTDDVWITNIGISSVGNIISPYFIGDGSQLTNIAVGNNGAVQVNWMGALSNQGGTPGDTYSTLQFDSNGMPTLSGTTAYQQRVDYSPYLQVLTPRVESEDFGIVAGPGVTVVGYDDNYNTPRSAYLSVQDQANVTQQWDFGILGNGNNNFSITDRTSSNVFPNIANSWVFGTDGSTQFPANTIKSTGQLSIKSFDSLLDIQSANTTVGSGGEILLNSGFTGPSSAGVQLVAYVDGTQAALKTWNFGADGNLTLPGNSEISINYANGQPYGGTGGNASTGNFTFDGDDMLMPLVAQLNSGGIGNTNAAEFGTEVYSNGTAITGSQIYMGAGTTEIRGIVDAAGAGLMYAGVEGEGFAGIVGMDPGVTSQYAIAVGTGNTILLGATQPGGTLTTTEYTAGVGALNANGTINGLLASSSNVVISNGNTAGWSFATDGGTIFPTLTTQRGDNPSGTISGQTLLFGDAAQEAIISTPDGVAGNEYSQRLVINPGAGYDYGEGGDIYLWAGRGGDNNGSGGDVKIRGGQGMGESGSGGYIRMEGGDSQDRGYPGYINITAGYGANTYGAYVNITGGGGGNGQGGPVQLQGGFGAAGFKGGDANIIGGSSADGAGNYGNVNINSGGLTWSFNNNGTTQFPSNYINPGEGNPLTIRTQDGNAYTQVDYESAVWVAQTGDDTSAANPAFASIATDLFTTDTPTVYIQTQKGSDGIVNTWTFDQDGKITLPFGAALKDTSGDSVAFGQNAGNTSQQRNAVAIGSQAGREYQGEDSIAIGKNAGYYNQNRGVAIGYHAGQGTQGYTTVSDANGGSGPAHTYVSGDGNPSLVLNSVTDVVTYNQYVTGNNIPAYTYVTNIYPGEDRIDISQAPTAALSPGDAITFIGSNIGVASTSGLVAGARIFGTNIPDNTFINSIIGPNNIDISQRPSAPLVDAADLSFYIGQGDYATAVGYGAGTLYQDSDAVAVGYNAGTNHQGASTVAVGVQAGAYSQSTNAVAVGASAGAQTQGINTVAVGYRTGGNVQGNSAVAIGEDAGYDTQGPNAVSIGSAAGFDTQGVNAVAIGLNAGRATQGNAAVAIGWAAGYDTQGANSVAIGADAGLSAQGNVSVAIGTYAGGSTQGQASVAMGFSAGRYTQGNSSVALGEEAGYTGQGQNSIAIGRSAGQSGQGNAAIAMGWAAAQTTQGTAAVAIGEDAGRYYQGEYSIAIGYQAGYNSQGNNSIVLNASGGQINGITANSFTVKPIRNATTGNVLYYDQLSGEITFDVGGSGGLPLANGTSNFDIATANGNATITANSSSTWTFDTTGNLTLPRGGKLLVSGGIVGGGASPAPSLSGFSSLTAYGNITGGNFLTGGYLSVAGDISAVGNVTGGNIVTSGSGGDITLTSGNITGANNISTGTITLTNGAVIKDTAGNAVVFGQEAGNTGQGTYAVAIGAFAGQTNQGLQAVAIGGSAGATSQGAYAVAIGAAAGAAGNSAVAIGVSSGFSNQGNFAVAIGASAGATNQGNNSIILNATGAALDQTTANTFTVAPVRNDVANTGQVVFYNTSSKEITYGNTISVAGNITAANFFGNGNTLSNVATQVTGTWTVPVGNSTQSFTVSNIGTYSMWVDCNITNGILAWNATATVTNNNVPVVGAQYAWVYNGGGSPVDFTSIPNQFIGTANTIVRSSVAASATTNRFDFGINNTSGGNVTVRYGYTKIS